MREWLLTNGIGGYAASTDFGGMNTRRYHGLLVASMNPPGQRKLVLSKVDESIKINDKYYTLFTNDSNGNISEGHNYQIDFNKEEYVTYKFQVEDVTIEKNICMIYGKNAVVVYYKVFNQDSDAILMLTPLVNFRDFHSIKSDLRFNYTQIIDDNKIELVFNEDDKVNIGVKESTYNPHREDFYKNMHYSMETKRGFFGEDNHIVPGTFEIEIKPHEEKEITFICATGGKYGIDFDDILDIDGKDVLNIEKDRIEKLIRNSELLEGDEKEKSQKKYIDLVKKYIIASDNFIVKRDSNNLHTLIAGYPWFLDWGRDTLISFEGILLKTRRFKEALEVLETYLDNIKDGLVPNGFDEYSGHPLYNSVDASLWLFEAINKYIEYTGNYDFLKPKYFKTLRNIIDNYIDGINLDNNNIYVDEEDFLVNSGTDNTQNTWMDARVNGLAVTPRNGKAVEINALWYNALRVMQDICMHFGNVLGQAEYSYIARKCKKSFNKKFYDDEKKTLYDVINKDSKDDRVRPNQIISMGLTYPVLDVTSKHAKEVFITVTKDLLTKFGLRTLASYEQGYAPKYEGDPAKRDYAYHQGTVWPWLLGPYFKTVKNMINEEKKHDFKVELYSTFMQLKDNVKENFTKELVEGNTVGSICEIYDAENPKQGKGAFAQGWSVSEVFKILLDDEKFDI